MAKKRKHKKSDKNETIQTLILITAILNILKSIIDFVKSIMN